MGLNANPEGFEVYISVRTSCSNITSKCQHEFSEISFSHHATLDSALEFAGKKWNQLNLSMGFFG
jgi:hypothetical protein